MSSDRSTAPPGQPRLSLDLQKRWGDFDLTARFAAGSEVLVLFGPSGAGKTSCLNAIAGLLSLDAGEIILDGETLFRKDRPGRPANLPARQRCVGYVFQQFALFPHLSAAENAAYALRSRRDRRQVALKLLEQMGIGHMADRYPHEMSGGQQQRVALARALAAQPRVLLLDEPFSALDAAVRQRLQGDLAALQADLGLIMIYVTHHLEDALALGQRIAVIRDGQVKQVGPIEEVFRYPANPEVAEVMGIRNLFRAKVIDASAERLLLDWDGLHLEAPPQPVAIGAAVAAYIQPGDVKILYPDRPIMSAVYFNRVRGVIVSNDLTPGAQVLQLSLPNGHSVEVRFPTYTYTSLCLEAGQQVEISLRKEALVLLQH
jgi:molybdate transport system ATP-binding protein